MSATARIHDQGHRRYEGPRLGVAGAVRSVAVYTFRHLTGIRRRTRAKVLPWSLIIMAILPALSFVGFTVLLPDVIVEAAAEQALPDPGELLGGITLLVFVGAALAGPAALVPDRREGMLAHYLAAPLTRTTYLMAKAIAILTFMGLLTIVPPLLYSVGKIIAGVGPDGPGEVAVEVGRVLLAGAAMALILGGLSAVAGSFADRQGAGSTIVGGWLLLSAIAIGALQATLDLPAWFGLLDINRVGVGVAFTVHGNEGGPIQHVGSAAMLAGAVAWIAGTWGLALWRTRRQVVTR